MHRLIQILVVDSIRDLIRYKSFFLLVALLLIADRVLRNYVKIRPEGFKFPSSRELGIAADWLFLQAPNLVNEWLLDWRTLLIGGCLGVGPGVEPPCHIPTTPVIIVPPYIYIEIFITNISNNFYFRVTGFDKNLDIHNNPVVKKIDNKKLYDYLMKYKKVNNL